MILHPPRVSWILTLRQIPFKPWPTGFLEGSGQPAMRVLMSLAGMALILFAALLLSSNRRAIRLRVVAPAFVLQAGFAALGADDADLSFA